MKKRIKCYVGTNSLRNSKGIYVLEVNIQTGELEIVSFAEADNSAYLYISKKRNCLYAVMESLEYQGLAGGGVAAYRIEGERLTFLNSRYAYGGWPCHLSADEERDTILVSVFRNGLLLLYDLEADGRIGKEKLIQRHLDPNGTASHIHAAILTPDQRYLAVADCGLDRIYFYDADTYRKAFEWEGPAGCGPRQLAFSPDGKYLYMVSELSCQVFVVRYQPDCDEMIAVRQKISTKREDGYEGLNFASAIHFHPSGKYLLTGNRGHNSIAIYTVDSGSGLISLQGHTMLAGDHCREFCFTEDGSMLIVGIQHTDIVQTFFFDADKGSLTWSGKEIAIPSPSCVVIE